MNVSLTSKIEAFIRAKVASGLYSNASEVVRDAMRRYIEHEADPRPPATCEETIDVLRKLQDGLYELGIEKAGVFGSVARNDMQAGSDVDIVVGLAKEGSSLTLPAFVGLESRLQELLGGPVDVVVLDDLEPSFREAVLRDAIWAF